MTSLPFTQLKDVGFGDGGVLAEGREVGLPVGIGRLPKSGLRFIPNGFSLDVGVGTTRPLVLVLGPTVIELSGQSDNLSIVLSSVDRQTSE
jgi:hypothetical protein